MDHDLFDVRQAKDGQNYHKQWLEGAQITQDQTSSRQPEVATAFLDQHHSVFLLEGNSDDVSKTVIRETDERK